VLCLVLSRRIRCASRSAGVVVPAGGPGGIPVVMAAPVRAVHRQPTGPARHDGAASRARCVRSKGEQRGIRVAYGHAYMATDLAPGRSDKRSRRTSDTRLIRSHPPRAARQGDGDLSSGSLVTLAPAPACRLRLQFRVADHRRRHHPGRPDQVAWSSTNQSGRACHGVRMRFGRASRLPPARADLANGFANNGPGQPRMQVDLAARASAWEQAGLTTTD
jgi:hypothetical protein